ncbi:hypothetical protein GN956_G24476 [Arapaima gigas]
MRSCSFWFRFVTQIPAASPHPVLLAQRICEVGPVPRHSPVCTVLCDLCLPVTETPSKVYCQISSKPHKAKADSQCQ